MQSAIAAAMTAANERGNFSLAARFKLGFKFRFKAGGFYRACASGERRKIFAR
jgi:hypothetical protein